MVYMEELFTGDEEVLDTMGFAEQWFSGCVADRNLEEIRILFHDSSDDRSL